MIRRLRWKFTGVMTVICALFLSGILLSLYYTSRVNFQQGCLGILQAVLMDDGEHPDPPRRLEDAGNVREERNVREGKNDREDGFGPPEERMPLLLAEADADGEIRILFNRIYQLDEEAARSLVAQIREMGTLQGVLEDQSLRFLRSEPGPDGTARYALADIYQEQTALHWQAVHSLIIGLLALSALFVVFIFLSRWITAPASHAWDAQQQFISDASHELKTPLTVILANIGLLRQSPFIRDENDRLRMDHIASEAGRMKQLTENLLTLARSDCAGSPPAESLVPVDFSFLTDSCISTFEPLAFEMGKSISGDVQPDVTVRGDEAKLRRLLSILLDNGCKYSRPDSCIQVQLKKEGQDALLTVTSSGTPLAPEELRQLFHRFYRADPSRGTVAGFGLGLSIAQSICGEHRGKITASTDGRESNTFSVRLPLCRKGGD